MSESKHTPMPLNYAERRLNELNELKNDHQQTEGDMKSVNEMTSSEMIDAKKSGATVYGARLYRLDQRTRKPIYSDVEDFSLKALRTTVRGMLGRGFILDEEWVIPEPPDDGSGDFDDDPLPFKQRRIQGTRCMEVLEGKVLLPPRDSSTCDDSESFAVFEYTPEGLQLVSTHLTATLADIQSTSLNKLGTGKYDWAHTTVEHYAQQPGKE